MLARLGFANGLDELRDLVARINLTNSKAVYNGDSITEMLSRRDALNMRVKIMRTFLDEVSHLSDRYSRSEIKVVSAVDVGEMRKPVDAERQGVPHARREAPGAELDNRDALRLDW